MSDLTEELLPETDGEKPGASDEQIKPLGGAERVAPRRRTRRGSRVPIALGALLVVGLVVWRIIGASGADQSTPQYTTSTADKSTLAVTVDGSGYVYAAKSASVSAKVSGTVTGLRLAVGTRVNKGGALFHVDNDDLDSAITKCWASYRQSKQAVHQAELQLLQARQQRDKLEDAVGTARAPSELDLDIARERVYAAEQGLSAAKASRQVSYHDYEKALQDKENRTVRAPMDGVITEINVENGDSVSGGGSSSSASASTSSGQSSTSGGTGSSASASSGTSSSGGNSSGAMVITNMRSLYAEVTVNEVDVSKLKRGQKATVSFDAIPNLTITGKVGRISPAGTNTQGVVTFDVNVGFDVQNARLKPGMTASASIVTALARDAVLVPNAAVQTSNGESYVQVLKDASGTGTPSNVAVTVGLANDTLTQIKTGLKGGENVVTGQRVTSGTTSSGSSSGLRFPGMGSPPSDSGGSRSRQSGSGSGSSSSGGTTSGGGTGIR